MATFDIPQFNVTFPDITKMTYYDLNNYLNGNRSLYTRKLIDGSYEYGYRDYKSGEIISMAPDGQLAVKGRVSTPSKPSSQVKPQTSSNASQPDLSRFIPGVEPVVERKVEQPAPEEHGPAPIRIQGNIKAVPATSHSNVNPDEVPTKVQASTAPEVRQPSLPVSNIGVHQDQVEQVTTPVQEEVQEQEPVTEESNVVRVPRAAYKRNSRKVKTNVFEKLGVSVGNLWRSMFRKKPELETRIPSRAELRRQGVTGIPSTGGSKYGEYLGDRTVQSVPTNKTAYNMLFREAQDAYEQQFPTEHFEIDDTKYDVQDISAEINRLIEQTNLPIGYGIWDGSQEVSPIVQEPVVEQVTEQPVVPTEYRYQNVHDARGIYSEGRENNRAFAQNLYHGYLGAFKDYIKDPGQLHNFAMWLTMLSAGETSYGRTPRTPFNYGNLNYNTNFKNLQDYLNAEVASFNKYHKSSYNATSLEDFIHRLKLSNYYEAPESTYKKLLLGVRDRVKSYIEES